jgi:O-antigen/teichoic acid export membrane protein
VRLGTIEIRNNIISNGIYLIINAISLFIIFKLIIDRLGKDALGIWSVLFSFLVVIINSGSATNTDLVRKYLDNYNKLNAEFIGKQLINSIIVYIIYFIIYASTIASLLFIFLPDLIKEQIITTVIMLAAILISLINYAMGAILDSTKLNYVKNIILIISTLFFLLVSNYLITKSFGISGISLAYLFQFLLLFLLYAIVIFRKFSPEIKLKHISRREIKGLIKSGWKLQLVSLITISYDPITKYFLLQNSTLEYIAKFEIANRLINQIRTLVITSNQTLVPNLKIENDKYYNSNLLEKLFFNNLKSLSGLYFLLALFIPFLQKFYFDTGNFQFSLTCLLLMIGYGLNVLSGSFYFFFLANGKDDIILKSHFLTGTINFVIPIFLTFINNLWPISPNIFGVLITSSWALALIFSAGLMKMEYYSFRNKLKLSFAQKHLGLLSIMLLAMIIVIFSYKIDYHNIHHMIYMLLGIIIALIIFSKDIKKSLRLFQH